MPEVSADGREFTVRLRPGIHFFRPPGVPGPATRADGARPPSTPSSASSTRAGTQRPLPVRIAADPRHGRLSLRRPQRRPWWRRSRSTTTARWRVCARSTATSLRITLGVGRPALHLPDGRPGVHGRGGARGGRAPWRRHRRAPHRHRRLAGAVAARLAPGAGALAHAPRPAVRRHARPTTRWRSPSRST